MSSPEPPPSPTPSPTASRARSRRGVVAAIALLVLLAVAGGAYAVSHRTKSAAKADSGTPAAGAGSAKTDRLRGKVESISGNALVLKVKKVSTTVTLTANTKFGNKKTPATRADIKPGVVVVVVGPTSNPTRVLVPATGGASKPATPSPSG